MVVPGSRSLLIEGLTMSHRVGVRGPPLLVLGPSVVARVGWLVSPYGDASSQSGRSRRTCHRLFRGRSVPSQLKEPPFLFGLLFLGRLWRGFAIIVVRIILDKLSVGWAEQMNCGVPTV